MASEAFRALTDIEAAALHKLTSVDFPEAASLRAQIPDARVRTSCECGCGTIAFELAEVPNEPLMRGRRADVEANIVGDKGDYVGGLILWLDSVGRLAELEIYDWDTPLPIPPAYRIQPYLRDWK